MRTLVGVVFGVILAVAGVALAQKLQPGTGIILVAPTDGLGNVCTSTTPCGNQTFGGNTSTKPQTVSYSGLDNTSIATQTAVSIISTIPTGCYFVNTTTGVTVTVSLHGTANATSLPLQPLQAYTCPYPSSQGVSVYNPSATVVATVSGEKY